MSGTESSMPTGPSSHPQISNDKNTTIVDMPRRWPIMRGSRMLPNIGAVLSAVPPMIQAFLFNGFYECMLVGALFLVSTAPILGT